MLHGLATDVVVVRADRPLKLDLLGDDVPGLPGLDDSSNWDGILDTYPKAGTWHVCVVAAEGSKDCISTTVTAETTADPCTPESGGVQIVRIIFQLN